ncbi:MAG: hypothetical protein R2698_12400 [Microthrixaceae bacterium]
MTDRRVVLASMSAAMDGGFTAVADVSSAMATTGMTEHHRLIGGVAVMLHIQRLQLDLPLRATGDADFGVPPHVLREPELVDAIEDLGYRKVAGNRWERPIDERRVASVDLLIPTYRSRARDTVKVGSIVTSEVPGLAEAFQRPAVNVAIDLHLTDRETLSTTVSLPDAVGMLALKVLVRTVRTEDRDVEDLWRCLEIAAAEGVDPTTFDSSEPLRRVRAALWLELGPNGDAVDKLTAGLQSDAAARLRTRVRALLTETVGPSLPGRRPRPRTTGKRAWP